MRQPVVIVPTGTANMASVSACLRRLGWDTRTASEAEHVASADRVVLPGVGTFGAAMARLDELDLVEALRQRLLDNRPTMAICVGMQLLATESDESPDQTGLGILPGAVTRFRDDLRVPQLGWNLVTPDSQSRFITPGWAYFANSYKVDAAPRGWSVSHADHGGDFLAAVETGDVLACQFHPELSADWGERIVDRWLGGGAR